MLPKVALVANYGGPLNDYSAPSDSSTDRPASGTNPAYTDVAAMTHTIARAWARITVKSAGTTPALVANDEVWNNGNNAAPVLARSSAGVVTLTYPTTVQDEIPINRNGYIGPVSINLRSAWANDRGGTTWNDVKAVPTAANIVTLYFYKLSGGVPTLGDPGSDVDVDVFSL